MSVLGLILCFLLGGAVGGALIFWLIFKDFRIF